MTESTTTRLSGPQDQRQHLTFELGGETYAIGIKAIKEIIEYGKLTEVPLMPAHVRGVINLRGTVVPVVDLAVSFGKPATQVSRRSCIVIVELAVGRGHQDFGIIVDAVHEVLDIPGSEMAPPPDFGLNLRPDCISAIAKTAADFVIVLAMDRIFSADGLAGVGPLPEDPAAQAGAA